MTAIAEKLAKEIAQLSPDEILDIHAHLLKVFYSRQEMLEPAFRTEISRRIEEIDSGNIVGVDAFEALKKM